MQACLGSCTFPCHWAGVLRLQRCVFFIIALQVLIIAFIVYYFP